MAYASNVERASDAISQLTEEPVRDYEDLTSKFEADRAEKDQEYADKYKEIENIGQDYLATHLGAKGLIAAGSKIRKGIKAGKELIDAGRKVANDVGTKGRALIEGLGERGGTLLNSVGEDGIANLADAVTRPSAVQAVNAADQAAEDPELIAARAADRPFPEVGYDRTDPSKLPEDETEDMDRTTSFGEESNQPTETTKASNTGDDAPSTETPPDLEGGGEEDLSNLAGESSESSFSSFASGLADTLGISSVADAIPVVGEVALLGSAFAAIGEGIAHLVHPRHHSTPPPPPPVQSFQLNSDLTSKYSEAVPSFDTAVDRSGAATNF